MDKYKKLDKHYSKYESLYDEIWNKIKNDNQDLIEVMQQYYNKTLQPYFVLYLRAIYEGEILFEIVIFTNFINNKVNDILILFELAKNNIRKYFDTIFVEKIKQVSNKNISEYINNIINTIREDYEIEIADYYDSLYLHNNDREILLLVKDELVEISREKFDTPISFQKAILQFLNLEFELTFWQTYTGAFVLLEIQQIKTKAFNEINISLKDIETYFKKVIDYKYRNLQQALDKFIADNNRHIIVINKNDDDIKPKWTYTIIKKS